jgi:hypothetical protein
LEKSPELSTQNLLNQFYQDQKLPKLANEQVLIDSLIDGVEKLLFRIEDRAYKTQNQVKNLSEDINNQISIEFSQNQIILSTILEKQMKSVKCNEKFIENKMSYYLKSIEGVRHPQLVDDDDCIFQINELNSKLFKSFQEEVLGPLVRNSNEVWFDVSIRIKNSKNENERKEISAFKTAFKRFMKNRTDSKNDSSSNISKK